MQTYPTYDGNPNLNGYFYERLIDKVKTLGRICNKIKSHTTTINDELYSMYIPCDVLDGFFLLQEALSIVSQFGIVFTNFKPTNDEVDMASGDSLKCLRLIRRCVVDIEYAAWFNPKGNLTANVLDTMCRDFAKFGRKMDLYLEFIWGTHRNVQAE